MNALDRIGTRELKEFLSKGWITHDAMWFYNAVRECGIETANRMNLGAIRMMAPLEMKRTKKILNVHGDIERFDDLMEFMRGAYDLVIPEFMRYSFTIPERNRVEWEWEKEGCFAYRGVRDAGFIEGYRCGVMHRINCWYDALGVQFELTPPIEGCLMHTQGSCRGTYRFFFDR
ncbi:MAG: hypothetical protein JXA20_13880 [Spirochaetes bacterium]|nr:hypothetical protein [Spirochaetota bacterium]